MIAASISGAAIADDHEKTGVEFGVSNTTDLIHYSNDAVDGGAVVGRIGVTVDGEITDGLSYHVNPIITYGGHPNEKVGAYQGINNAEVGENLVRFLDAYVNYEINENFSVKGGILAADSDYYITDNSGTLMHPSFGMSAEVAQTGLNGPSVYPITGLGVQVNYADKSNWYGMLSARDGVPGNPNNGSSGDIAWRSGDGALVMLEGGKQTEAYKLGAGAWYYTEKTETIADPLQSKHNSGIYFLGETKLNAQYALFGRIGMANSDVNQFDWSTQFGVKRDGLFTANDEAVVGVAYAHNASDWVAAEVLAGNAPQSKEVAYEIAYKYPVNDNFFVQPDYQFIDSDINTNVFSLRIGAEF